MGAWRVAAHIREIEVLGDEETVRGPRRAPDSRIRLTFQAFGASGVNVVTKCGQRRDEAFG